jgi:hypothetical protein
VSKANFEFQTQRIKMSLNQVKRDKLFEALTDYNNELRDLLDTSDRIAALRQSRGVEKRSAVNKGLWNFLAPCGQTLQLADTVMAVRLQEVSSSQSLLTVSDDFEGGI